MGIEFATEQLYATGWAAMDTAGCEPLSDGRWVPSVERISAEFSSMGLGLSVTHVQLFECFRAEWGEPGGGEPAGAVVGQTEHEAAVYALAQARQRAGVGGRV